MTRKHYSAEKLLAALRPADAAERRLGDPFDDKGGHAAGAAARAWPTGAQVIGFGMCTIWEPWRGSAKLNGGKSGSTMLSH